METDERSVDVLAAHGLAEAPVGPVSEHLFDRRAVEIERADDDSEPWVALAECGDRGQSLRERHLHIENHDIGPLVIDHGEGGVLAVRLPDEDGRCVVTDERVPHPLATFLSGIDQHHTTCRLALEFA